MGVKPSGRFDLYCDGCRLLYSHLGRVDGYLPALSGCVCRHCQQQNERKETASVQLGMVRALARKQHTKDVPGGFGKRRALHRIDRSFAYQVQKYRAKD